MGKVVVNFSIDEGLMNQFRIAVVKEKGKSREMSKVIEGLMTDYVNKVNENTGLQ